MKNGMLDRRITPVNKASVICGGYVVYDGSRWRFSTHLAQSPPNLLCIIMILSFQFRKLFSGTLVAIYLIRRRWIFPFVPKLEILLGQGGTYMNLPYIHQQRGWSADLNGMEDLAICKVCLFAGRAIAVSRYARHCSVPVGLRMLCPACAAVVRQGIAIMG